MPRKTALEALERCRRGGAWSGQVLTALTQKNNLNGRDAALAARLFYGTLQNLTLLDYYISAFARGELEPKVRDILRLGVYQILFMDRIPDHAAVSESVELCRKTGFSRAVGLVNAVLRRITENKSDLPMVPDAGTASYLSVQYSHPLWLVNELIALRGPGGAEAVLRADNEPAPVTIQTNTMKTTPEALAGLLEAEPCEVIDGCLVLQKGGDFTRSDAFRQGLFYVQDPAARLAVHLAGPEPGMRVLDACAAPGGKSFACAIAMQNQGEIISRDISASKLALVSQGAERLGLPIIRCEAGDATEFAGADFDVVLADVPCSGLGVIRKKPEIRYRPQTELDKLPALQKRILNNLGRSVKPGGVIVYSTCTWRTAENADVTEAFLRENQQFVKEEERTLWPDLDGTDGFYLCRMHRKNSI